MPSPQNGQTHSINSSADCVFDNFVGLTLKGLIFSVYEKISNCFLIPSANLHVCEFDCKAIFPEVVRRTYDPEKYI